MCSRSANLFSRLIYFLFSQGLMVCQSSFPIDRQLFCDYQKFFINHLMDLIKCELDVDTSLSRNSEKVPRNFTYECILRIRTRKRICFFTLSAAVNWASAASRQFILIAYRPRRVWICGLCDAYNFGWCWHNPHAWLISCNAKVLFPITNRHMIICSSSINWKTVKMGLLSTTKIKIGLLNNVNYYQWWIVTN